MNSAIFRLSDVFLISTNSFNFSIKSVKFTSNIFKSSIIFFLIFSKKGSHLLDLNDSLSGNTKFNVKYNRQYNRQFLNEIREILWFNKQLEQRNLIAKLNLVIRGWAMYYRYSDANKAFNQVDHEILNLIWKWVKRRHKSKSKKWIYNRYFNTIGDRKWLFQDKRTGYTLTRASYVIRLKYDFVVNNLSPIDPDSKVKKVWRKKRYQEIEHMMI
jgi:RNA-directed DNA polymerase